MEKLKTYTDFTTEIGEYKDSMSNYILTEDEVITYVEVGDTCLWFDGGGELINMEHNGKIILINNL